MGSSTSADVVQHSMEQPCVGSTTDHFFVYNNIFYDSTGSMYAAYKYDNGTVLDWTTGNNCYWNNGSAIPSGTGGVVPNPNTETGAQIGNPGLSFSGTPSSWQTWVNYYRPLWNSQSNAMLKDKGTSAAGTAPQPAVLFDVEGNPRPRDNGWDIGPYEYQGVTATPTANFLPSTTWGTPPCPVQFTDYSSGGPTSWSWTFGDGGTSTAENPSHTYTTNGVYTVALTATNSAGSNTDTQTNCITIKPLNAAFTATPTWGTAPLSVSFADQSSNSPTSWSWTFGDGGTSTAQNPSHSYNSVGYYTVALTARNANGSDTDTQSNYIVVCTTSIVNVDTINTFSGQGTITSGGTAQLQTQDSSYLVMACDPTYYHHIELLGHAGVAASAVQGILLEYVGHGSPANGQVFYYWVRHGDGSYDKTPMWQTTLPTTDTYMSYSISAPSTFMASDGTLGVQYCGCVSNPVPSGTSSVYSDLAHWKLYLKPGQIPVANFSGTPTSGIAPLTVAFTDSSTNSPTSWSWTFGDGGTSTAQNPSHTYGNAGTYTVTLTATNSAGSSSPYSQTNYISVTAGSVFFPTSYVSQGTWASGTDSNLDAPDGVYEVYNSTTDSDKALCVDHTFSTGYTPSQVASLKVEYLLHASLTNSPNTTIVVQRTDANWDTAVASFVPGTTDVWESWTTTNVSTYLQSNGNIKFRTCACGRDVGQNYTLSYDCVRLTLTFPQPVPVANFSAMPLAGSSPLAVSFTDSSTNSPTSWSWTFGDGGTSTVQNPYHIYTSGGSYTVTLTATNSGGSSTPCSKSNYITVATGLVFYPSSYVSQGTLASGSDSNLTAADGVYETFNSTTDSTKALCVDDTFSTGYAPSQVASLQVQYLLHASLTNSPNTTIIVQRTDSGWDTAVASFVPGLTDVWNGWQTTNISTYLQSNGSIKFRTCCCGRDVGQNYSLSYDYVALSMALNPGVLAPVANFSGTPTSGNAPLAVNFTDSSTNTPTAWSWTFGDTTSSTVRNPSHTYTGVGSYTVALTATNAGGNNTLTKTNYISATAPAPVANFSGTPTCGAAPLAVTFTDSSTNSPTAWSWTFGDGGTSTAQNPSHSYTSAGSFTVALTATNAYGNNTLTKSNYITAAVTPVANFSGTPTTGNTPLAVSFTDSSTNAPTSWSWTFGDGGSSTLQNPFHIYTSAGAYTVALTATNSAGSSSPCSKSSYISITAGLVFYPTSSVSQGTLASGSDSNLTAADGVYETYNSSATYSLCVDHVFSTGYTPSQVASLQIQYRLHASLTNSPNVWVNVQKLDSTWDTAINTFVPGTTDVWESWTTTNVSTYLQSNGTIRFRTCGCGNTYNELYTFSYDYVALTLTLNPPVANFSGTPTTGNSPLERELHGLLHEHSDRLVVDLRRRRNSSRRRIRATPTRLPGSTRWPSRRPTWAGTTPRRMTNYISVNVPVANFSGTPTSGNKTLERDLHRLLHQLSRPPGVGPSGMAAPLPSTTRATPTPPRASTRWPSRRPMPAGVTRRPRPTTSRSRGTSRPTRPPSTAGTTSSGSYTNTQAADASYWVVTAAKVGSYYQDQETYTMSTGMSSCSQIIIYVKGKVSTGTQTEKIYLYNNSTSAWDLEKTVTLNTTNTQSSQTVTSASNYMSSGTVKVRVFVGGTGTTTYTHSTDYVDVNCTP